jgi:hypothetical protein
MNAFEFVILFFSFIYTLALTHMLFAWTRMIRHRRELVFSWPHLLWMLAALFNLTDNWISLWDFRAMATLSLGTIAIGFAFVTLNYFLCALVSPDFEGGETYDMKRFHDREGRTYVLAYLVLACFALLINFTASVGLGLSDWAKGNWLILLAFPFILLALFVRRTWVQIASPAAELALTIAFAVIYYPALRM